MLRLPITIKAVEAVAMFPAGDVAAQGMMIGGVCLLGLRFAPSEGL